MSFLSPETAVDLAREFGAPLYVYDETALRTQARAVMAFPRAYGFSARYAMKAAPTAAVLRVLADEGLRIDASSGYEAERALRAGIAPELIQITAQQWAPNLPELHAQGVAFNACSLRQLELFGQHVPGGTLGVRINPGLGSGHNNRTNTGGPSASFGIWHEYLPDVLELAAKHGLNLVRMHTHIGSGGDPEAWVRCASLALAVAAQLPTVQELSLGGGFKVGRMPGEPSADLEAIGEAVRPEFERFAREDGRELHLEIEPGTYLAANSAVLLAEVDDVVDTGPEGYSFLKTNTGMTEILRPSLYGAQHPIELVQAEARSVPERAYVVVGHCCESGDILTPEPGNPEGLACRTLPEAAPGDLLIIGGAGAYCSSMAAKNYNAFPEAAEVMLGVDGSARLIRRRQTLDQMLVNEIPL